MSQHRHRLLLSLIVGLLGCGSSDDDVGPGDDRLPEEIACTSVVECPTGSRWCSTETGHCAGCDEDGQCPVGNICNHTTRLCECTEPGESGCACKADGSCNDPLDLCLTRDDHWECTEDCICAGLYSWKSAACYVPECNNECAVAQREETYASFDDELVPMPAECLREPPTDGVFVAVKDASGAGVIPEVNVEIREGKVLTVDGFPCEDVFPGQTSVFEVDTCDSLYRCGCCFWWYGPARSGSGWGLRSDEMGLNPDFCDYTLGGSYYDIGGHWVPPTPSEEEVPETCTQDWGCCEFCGDQCHICDSIRDMQCFVECYGECHRCCFQCG